MLNGNTDLYTTRKSRVIIPGVLSFKRYPLEIVQLLLQLQPGFVNVVIIKLDMLY